jgi:hypothetical protein
MKRPIGAHQQQRFTDRLGHQQAVQRITVMERQLLERQQVGEGKGEELKATLLSPRNRLGRGSSLIAQRKVWVSSKSRIRPAQTAQRSADWRHRSSLEP